MPQKNSDQFKPCCGNCCFYESATDNGWGECHNDKGGCFCKPDMEACYCYATKEQARHYLHVLTEHNKWRRDDNVPNSLEMQKPTEIGKAIDFATYCIKSFLKL